MTVDLPPLPSQRRLRLLCEEAASHLRVTPEVVEKDLYLTRLIWALAQVQGPRLLLKGGTLLSKVDLGYFRMSEDVDLVGPVPTGISTRYRSVNHTTLRETAHALRAVQDVVGVTLRDITGERWPRNEGAIWDLTYASPFGPQGIQLEVSLRHVLRPHRQARMLQLLAGPEFIANEAAFCYALDADEARAEKVRAAFTRSEPQARDFYDLRRLAEHGADFTSPGFRMLVDAKLAELGAPPLGQQPPRFGLTTAALQRLEQSIDRQLRPVLRAGEPRFDLQEMLTYFDHLWDKIHLT